MLLTDVGGVATGNCKSSWTRASVVGRVVSMNRIYETDAHALVFSARIYEYQLPITKKMIVSGVMYDQRIFPVGSGSKDSQRPRRHIDEQRKVNTLTRMR